MKEVVESMAKDKEDGILDRALVAENVHLLLNQKGGESANQSLQPPIFYSEILSKI